MNGLRSLRWPAPHRAVPSGSRPALPGGACPLPSWNGHQGVTKGHLFGRQNFLIASARCYFVHHEFRGNNPVWEDTSAFRASMAAMGVVVLLVVPVVVMGALVPAWGSAAVRVWGEWLRRPIPASQEPIPAMPHQCWRLRRCRR